ncbi:AAA family ATPase [Candidatus Spongiihabitans sp.]|uniref:AAA family ATPase n=1 Tax=Candidatus Spongiihabitans sp. TaxID=3101308 RepID=UPI003C6F6916
MKEESIDDVFSRRTVLPDGDADERLARLVGIDEYIERLSKILEMLLFPARTEAWRKRHHPEASTIFNYAKNKYPLVIIAGDVGTGKTELSETIGSRVARNGNLEITLFPMSLSTRGSGLVGEMTKLISFAFGYVEQECKKIAKSKDGSYRTGIILLIDEADALAQSRDSGQMHHEDRAGVNALIRGMDLLNRQRLPVVVIMCTNRLEAIDPAVARRAAETFMFERPNAKKRTAILKPALEELGFDACQIDQVVAVTGETEGRNYGYTFSDITHRLFHAITMSAYPDKPIDFDDVLRAANQIKPTPPFKN